MFRKKTRWGWATVKALIFAQIFYRFARFFLKAAEKQNKEYRELPKKKNKTRKK